MVIEPALERFESVMSAAWPELFAELRPGLDDDEMDQLRAAVQPFRLPHQVEALYRWRGGGDSGIFGGWRMRGLEDLTSFYDFTITELGYPRAWLPVFDDQIVNIVTLDFPGREPSDPSVWYGHTHDPFVHRLFDSMAAMLDVVCDAVDADAVVHRPHWGLGLLPDAESLDGRGWSDLRLHRSPGSFHWPDPPPGTYLSCFPEPAWPRSWLRAVGVTEESLLLRGATHTIAELLAAAESGPVTGTIRGRVITGSGGTGWWSPVVSDGSAEIVIQCDTVLVPITPSVGQEAEFDVVLESPATPDPVIDEDPLVAAVANRLRPRLPAAVARAARLT